MRIIAAVASFLATAVCLLGADSSSRAGSFSGIAVLGTDATARHPFASAARARVFLFVRSDCPITNRYAPELQRLAKEFAGGGAEFWLVYPDPAATARSIRDHVAQYSFPGTALRDPQHQLVKLAHATTAPEAAVFDSQGQLVYHGRIDDRWINPGKSRPAAQTHDLEQAIAAVLAGRRPAQTETHAVGCWLADIE
jgi:hypothetical protein